MRERPVALSFRNTLNPGWKELPKSQLYAETVWLKAAVYAGRLAIVEVDYLDARVRFSERGGKRERVKLQERTAVLRRTVPAESAASWRVTLEAPPRAPSGMPGSTDGGA